MRIHVFLQIWHNFTYLSLCLHWILKKINYEYFKIKTEYLQQYFFCTWQVCFGFAEQNIHPPVAFLAS